ncbi:hypothetical protein BLA29_010081, partial [Euroglyphus maynei]
MVSLQVFGNGSVQVANITPNYITTSMPSIIDTQQMEQERILARERVKQNHLNFIREQLMQILLAGRTPPAANNVTVSSLNADVVKIKQVVENGPPTPKMPTFDRANIIDNINVRSSSSSSSSSSSEVYAQRLQSFYPICNMTILDVSQNNNDEQMEMKLYFDPIIPKLPNTRTHVT